MELHLNVILLLSEKEFSCFGYGNGKQSMKTERKCDPVITQRVQQLGF